MKRIFFVIAIIFWACMFSQTYAQVFSLQGTLSGFKDSTRIILNPLLDNMDVDMDNETVVLLNNEKFAFTKKLDKPTKYSLRVRPVKRDNYKEFEHMFFWAENTEMKLVGEKGKVFQAEVSGSKIQDQYRELVSEVALPVIRLKQISDTLRSTSNLSEQEKEELKSRLYQYRDEWEKKQINFIYAHPNYYCTAAEVIFYITFIPNKIDVVRLTKFYNKMEPALRANIFGKQIRTFLNNVDDSATSIPLKIGDCPFDFTLKDSSNVSVKFSELTDKVILLDFWSSGCGPCRMEHRNYVKLYDRFKNKGFEIVSVSQDQSKKRYINAMIKDKMSWISLWDKDKYVSKKLYSISYLPANFLINSDGKIVGKDLRGELLKKELVKLIVE